MKLESIEQNISLLYAKAKSKFENCISNEDNQFLRNEAGIDLGEIVTIEKEVKIVFKHREVKNYLIEISLLLYSQSDEIGKYIYIENERSEEVDDSLIFY